MTDQRSPQDIFQLKSDGNGTNVSEKYCNQLLEREQPSSSLIIFFKPSDNLWV